jgi:hypothetical protein
MTTSRKPRSKRKIAAEEFDAKFERGEDILSYLDFKKAIVVRRVNVDFPSWMIELLDKEALKLNVSRQAIIKMWIHDRLAGRAPERKKVA